MMPSQQIPLVWTINGNVPAESLMYSTAWDIADTYIKFTETFKDSAGCIVKQSVHVYDKIGVVSDSAISSF